MQKKSSRYFSWLSDPSDRQLAFILLTPLVLLVSVIVIYPVLRLFYTSFFDYSLTSGLPRRFVGLENFTLVFTDATFWLTLRNTTIITIVTVPGALVMGMAMALLANMPFKRQWPIRLSLLIPWAIPLAFAGLMFAWFFNSEYGVVNDILRRTSLPELIWFNSPFWSMTAICLAIIWKTSSFMALVILAGLQTIPRSLYEAADVDGAGKWRQFRDITLPLLKPSIVVALIFRTISSLQTFDIPYIMTNGGPGSSTETLAMYIHQNTISFLDIGYGSTLAVVMFAISMIVSVIYLRIIHQQEER